MAPRVLVLNVEHARSQTFLCAIKLKYRTYYLRYQTRYDFLYLHWRGIPDRPLELRTLEGSHASGGRSSNPRVVCNHGGNDSQDEGDMRRVLAISSAQLERVLKVYLFYPVGN